MVKELRQEVEHGWMEVLSMRTERNKEWFLNEGSGEHSLEELISKHWAWGISEFHQAKVSRWAAWNGGKRVRKARSWRRTAVKAGQDGVAEADSVSQQFM